jgi:hypothetical protein
MSSPWFSFVGENDFKRFNPDVDPKQLGLTRQTVLIGDEEIPILYWVTDRDGDYSLRDELGSNFYEPSVEVGDELDFDAYKGKEISASLYFDLLYEMLDDIESYSKPDYHNPAYAAQRLEYLHGKLGPDPVARVEELIQAAIGDDYPPYQEFLKAYRAYRWFDTSEYGGGGSW